uniref:Sushi domain-containing protein n=1 Tax=Ciona intestinalis TaxID=7719 RepID=F6TPL8_CIOIN
MWTKCIAVVFFCKLVFADEQYVFDETGYEGDEFAREALREAFQQVRRAIFRTDKSWSDEKVWRNPMTLFQYFKRPPSEESSDMAKAGDIYHCAFDIVHDKVSNRLSRFKRRVNVTDVLSSATIAELAKFSGCRANGVSPTCPDTCIDNMYRTHTGECNNKVNRYWGASNNPFVRWRPAQYENEFSTPIGWNSQRSYNGYQLPVVRKVSNDIMRTSNTRVTGDPLYSHMLVVWGQYIDHDLDFTPQSLSTSTFQGLTDCKKTCKNESPCYPMQVPSDDPRITTASCLPFFRSAAVCGTGDTSSLFHSIRPREQINAVTSFVDASTVYGSTDSLNRILRNLTNDDGLMKVNTMFKDGNWDYLPFDPNNPCVQDPFDASGVNIPCFHAGDGRVSEHLTLSAIHTIWVREHNRIARMLKSMNPHWSGEIIYQEARKIVGAYHQIVHWKEYVPKIIGPAGLRMMGNYTGYRENENPTVSNVFATAAFRFGHATISPQFRRLDENFNNHPQFPTILLHEAFFSPWRMIREGGMDPILRGLIGRPAKLIKADEMMHEELRDKLFALQNQVALDLASLNLQRGRDHALPLYNDWREECGLARANNFSDLAGEIKNKAIRDKLEALYGHPGNIDLWLAGLSEDLMDGSRGGPVFTCLLARQFKFLRNGDRFYYENPNVFTPNQVTALNRLSFARVLCDNSGLTRVQPDLFMLRDTSQFVDCANIPNLDLSQWREDPAVGTCGTPPSISNGWWKKCGGGVSYRCMSGYQLAGPNEVQCMNSAFTAIPSCVDINECDAQNGGCSDRCMNTAGSYICVCNDDRMLGSDGKTCMATTVQVTPSPVVMGVTATTPANVTAIVVGSILGAAIFLAFCVICYLVYKNTKLHTKSKYHNTGKFSLSDPSAYDNPSAVMDNDSQTKM